MRFQYFCNNIISEINNNLIFFLSRCLVYERHAQQRNGRVEATASALLILARSHADIDSTASRQADGLTAQLASLRFDGRLASLLPPALNKFADKTSKHERLTADLYDGQLNLCINRHSESVDL